MIALLQRVTEAAVHVAGAPIGAIGPGLLLLIGVERHDTERESRRLLERILGYRVFADERGRMNVDVRAAGGGLLFVPQFTLAADTHKGTRPSFTPAAPPERGMELFELLVAAARDAHSPVESGRFGADMQVHLVNDGPVTLWLQVRPA